MSSATFDALRNCDVAALVAVITAAPTWDTLDAITGKFLAVAKAHPTKTLKAAQTIHAAIHAPDCPATIPHYDSDEPGKSLNLATELASCIYEVLASTFGIYNPPPGYARITPTNALLVAALVSGACERTALCRSSDQESMVYAGFQYPGYVKKGAAEQQLYAVHSCLALLVGGAEMYKEMERNYGKFTPPFEKLVDGEVMKDAGAKKLLQLTIQQVETEFSTDLDISEIWEALFPAA